MSRQQAKQALTDAKSRQVEIDQLITKVNTKTITQPENIELHEALQTKYHLAIKKEKLSMKRDSALESPQYYGEQCVFEEFAKISKLIHELSTAGMQSELKNFLAYLLDSKDTNKLNMNNECYGMFGPAMYETDDIVKEKYGQKVPFGTKTQEMYHVGHGQTRDQFSVEEVLDYRKSIHMFFGDLMKLSSAEPATLEELIIPLLNKLIRSEAEINTDFIKTLIKFVPEEALAAAGAVIDKFVDKTKPTTKHSEAAAADDDAAPAAEAKPIQTLQQGEFLRTCMAGANTATLEMFSGGNLAQEVNMCMGAHGKLPLGAACEANNLAAALNLITLGADPKKHDDNGKTAAEYIPAYGTALAELFNEQDALPATAPVFKAYQASKVSADPIAAKWDATVAEIEQSLQAKAADGALTLEDIMAGLLNIKRADTAAGHQYALNIKEAALKKAADAGDLDAMMALFTNGTDDANTIEAYKAIGNQEFVVDTLFD